MRNRIIENSIVPFEKALLQGERTVCSTLVKNLIDKNIPTTQIYEDLLKPSLYQIGLLWENNKISVASEHLASAIVEAILNENYTNIIPKHRINKSILTCCVEDEYHQIGIKMVNDIFEMNAWNTYFLGANTPLTDLISLTQKVKPNLIAISISLYFHFPKLENYIQKFQTEFKDLTILVGGQAFTRGGHEIISKYDNVIYMENLDKINSFIKEKQNG